MQEFTGAVKNGETEHINVEKPAMRVSLAGFSIYRASTLLFSNQ